MEKNQIEKFFKQTITENVNYGEIDCKLIYENEKISFQIENNSGSILYLSINDVNVVCDEIILEGFYLSLYNSNERIGEIKIKFLKNLSWDFDY